MVKGGDHCYALFMADTVPALMVLDATLKVVGFEQERVLTWEEMFTGDGKKPTSLNHDEIISEVRIPVPSPNSGAAYLKLSQRAAIDFPTLGVAARITLDPKNGICLESKLASTGVGSAPIELKGPGKY